MSQHTDSSLSHLGDLTRAIQQNEDHAATINALLNLLQLVHDASDDPQARRHYLREIQYYTRRLAQLHRSRDVLGQKVARLRKGGQL